MSNHYGNIVVTGMKRRRNTYGGNPVWCIVTENAEYTTQADAHFALKITGDERGEYDIVTNENRSVIGFTKHKPLPGDSDYVSTPWPPEQEDRLDRLIDEAVTERFGKKDT